MVEGRAIVWWKGVLHERERVAEMQYHLALTSPILKLRFMSRWPILAESEPVRCCSSRWYEA